MSSSIKKLRLLTPGPTPVPQHICDIMAEPIIHHRSKEFNEIFLEVQEGLHWLFGNDSDVLVLACSGTGAMESAVVNILSPGDTAITVNAGNFGKRWGEIINAYGVNCIELFVPWGEAVDPALIEATVAAHPEATALYLQATETSTGVSHPIREITQRLKSTGILTVVDGITAVGVDDLQQERDKIDVLITGSQKALMLPPGLACVGIRERAWSIINKAELPRYYLDWRAERRAQNKGQTRFTPTITLLVGLREVLSVFRKEGLENIWTRHAELANWVRSNITQLGLKFLANTFQSNAVTAVCGPEGCDISLLLENLQKHHGIKLAGGQGHLKDKIFRIGHLGSINKADLETAFLALENELYLMKYGYE